MWTYCPQVERHWHSLKVRGEEPLPLAAGNGGPNLPRFGTVAPVMRSALYPTGIDACKDEQGQERKEAQSAPGVSNRERVHLRRRHSVPQTSHAWRRAALAATTCQARNATAVVDHEQERQCPISPATLRHPWIPPASAAVPSAPGQSPARVPGARR